MRLIDADALAEDLGYDIEIDSRALDCTDLVGVERERTLFDKICKQNCMWHLTESPTIDAVPVVRCADCKWLQCNMRPDGHLPNGVDEYECRHWCGGCDPTDFCSYGEREEDGT